MIGGYTEMKRILKSFDAALLVSIQAIVLLPRVQQFCLHHLHKSCTTSTITIGTKAVTFVGINAIAK